MPFEHAVSMVIQFKWCLATWLTEKLVKRPLDENGLWVPMELFVLLFSIILLRLFTYAFLRVLLWTVLTQVNKSLFFLSTSQEIPSFIFQVLQTEFYPSDFSEPVKFENWSLRFWSALCEDNSCNFGINKSLFVSLLSSGKTKQKNPTLFNSLPSTFGFIAKSMWSEKLHYTVGSLKNSLFKLVVKV